MKSTTPQPWRAAMWLPIPGMRPTDVSRGSFKTAHDAQTWVRRLRLKGKTAGRRIVIWHESTLPPAELDQPTAPERPRLRAVS